MTNNRATDVAVSPDWLAYRLRMARLAINSGQPASLALDVLSAQLSKDLVSIDPFFSVGRFLARAGVNLRTASAAERGES